jgi:DNA-directed RNA polymerase subunit M/transcription elongation factor TFIIS
MTDDESTDGLEATFSLVANDIRLDILQTLWDSYTDDPEPEPEPVQFSTLKDRVGIRDSGQFHYHLDELVPQFVTHHEEGYTLTYAGARIIGATVSGIYTDTDVTIETRAIDDCSNCGGTLGLRYKQGHAVVDCDGCDATRIMSAPPILVGAHDVEENPELLGTFTMTQLQQTMRGFCYLCSGPVEGSVAESSLDNESGADENVKVVYECTECGAPFYTAATTAVLDHPAVVSLLHDAGIDYREIPSWTISNTLNAKERIRDTDPAQVEVTVGIDDDELTLVLDETLDVVEYTKG